MLGRQGRNKSAGTSIVFSFCVALKELLFVRGDFSPQGFALGYYV